MDDSKVLVKQAGALSALKAMLSFFMIFRLDITERDINAMDRNFHLVPIVGFLVGLCATVVVLIANFGFNFGGIALAAFTIAILLLATRFLHFDGLVDFGDGFLCESSMEKRLIALKDSTIGAGGLAVALVITLISFAMFSSMGLLLGLSIMVVEILTRNAMVSAAAFGVPGNGMAGYQVKNTTIKSLIYSTLISLVLAFAAFLLLLVVFNGLGLSLLADSAGVLTIVILLTTLVSIIIGKLMASYSNKRFEMVNGDILGATNEISRACMLIFFYAMVMIL